MRNALLGLSLIFAAPALAKVNLDTSEVYRNVPELVRDFVYRAPTTRDAERVAKTSCQAWIDGRTEDLKERGAKILSTSCQVVKAPDDETGAVRGLIQFL
ncbi:MAG TPA: hypothetical protein VM901_07245 [Bdellovibrionota bacterium]|jgi:hypothetical protein|nr:hypothetical protein [Bdellovibrionota bacterium]